MGKLGEVAFTGNATVNSDRYVPGPGEIHTLVVTPTQPGTAQLFYVSRYTGAEIAAHDTPDAVAANATWPFVIDFPIQGAYAGAFIRFVNNNNTPGTARFSSSAA